MTNYEIKRKGNWGYISPTPEPKLAKALDKYMSYERQGKEFMPNPAWAMVHLYSIKQSRFPWGFRYLVKRLLNRWCEVNKNDKYDYAFYITETPLNLIDGLEVMEKIFGNNGLRDYQQNAISNLIKYDGGILCMPTGSGKTKTALEYLKILDMPATIVVTTLDIKDQWEKQITDSKFKVINYQSKSCSELIKNSKIIIFDECHHVSAKTIYDLAQKDATTDSIIIGLSASPVREDGETMRITAAIGDIVYTISRRELINSGYLADATVEYYKTQFDMSQDKFLTYQDIYKKHIVENFYFRNRKSRRPKKGNN